MVMSPTQRHRLRMVGQGNAFDSFNLFTLILFLFSLVSFLYTI
jgi:hypothetical protein